MTLHKCHNVPKIDNSTVYSVICLAGQQWYMRWWPFVKEIRHWTMGAPHKGTVMRKTFPCPDVIICYSVEISMLVADALVPGHLQPPCWLTPLLPASQVVMMHEICIYSRPLNSLVQKGREVVKLVISLPAADTPYHVDQCSLTLTTRPLDGQRHHFTYLPIWCHGTR